MYTLLKTYAKMFGIIRERPTPQEIPTEDVGTTPESIVSPEAGGIQQEPREDPPAAIPPTPIVITSTPRPKKQPTSPIPEGFDPLAIDPPDQKKGNKKNGKKDKRV